MSDIINITTETLIRKRRDGQIERSSSAGFLSFASSNSGAGILKNAKSVIPFTTTASPILSNYQTYYSGYGEHPTIKLWTIDGDGNYIERNEQAKFIMATGLLDSIMWDLAGMEETGFIIIS